jgi:hypothetical protein
MFAKERSAWCERETIEHVQINANDTQFQCETESIIIHEYIKIEARERSVRVYTQLHRAREHRCHSFFCECNIIQIDLRPFAVTSPLLIERETITDEGGRWREEVYHRCHSVYFNASINFLCIQSGARQSASQPASHSISTSLTRNLCIKTSLNGKIIATRVWAYGERRFPPNTIRKSREREAQNFAKNANHEASFNSPTAASITGLQQRQRRHFDNYFRCTQNIIN